jgi:methionyl-tRNA formyltransferase
MADPLRVVFMGSDPIAIPLLDWLAGEGSREATIVGVLTGPDRPAGRGQAVKPNAVKAWAAGRPLEILQPEKPDEATLSAISALRPDVSLVVAYGHILRDNLISIPRLGTINLHASILPKYRGASPIQTAVACGDATTGMTLMRIVRELDAGPVGDVETVEIAPLDTAAEVESKLAACSIRLLSRGLPLLRDGRLDFKTQDHAKGTFCRRLEKADGVLDFSRPAAELAARVNGLNPWPGVAIDIAGTSVKMGQAEALVSVAPDPPGKVMGSDTEGLLVATGQGMLRIRRLQRPGGKMLGAAEFLRGFPVATGTVIASTAMPALVAGTPFRR